MELSLIWGAAVFLLLAVLAIPAFRKGTITGMAVLESLPQLIVNPLIMWIVLVAVVIGAAVLIDKKRARHASK